MMWLIADHIMATRSFEVSDTSQVLCLSQLDTVASVRQPAVVLKAENAFAGIVSICLMFAVGTNSISITFHSPTQAANERQAQQPFFVPYTKNPRPERQLLRKRPAISVGLNAALMPQASMATFSRTRRTSAHRRSSGGSGHCGTPPLRDRVTG